MSKPYKVECKCGALKEYSNSEWHNHRVLLCDSCKTWTDVDRSQYMLAPHNTAVPIDIYRRIPPEPVVIKKHRLATVCSGGVSEKAPCFNCATLIGSVQILEHQVMELRAGYTHANEMRERMRVENDELRARVGRLMDEASCHTVEDSGASAVAGATGVGMSRVLPVDVDYDW